MKLFISYSRDDKAWVYELWRNLRDKPRHDPWIDLDLKGATRWWTSILEAIEEAECFIMVMTPRSMESIYCLAELRYALALNVPILPLMLKPCMDLILPELSPIQFVDLTNSPAIPDILWQLERSLGQVRIDSLQGEYPRKPAKRPSEPSADAPHDIDEVYETAVDALEQGNYHLAEQLLRQVIKIDGSGLLGELAQDKLKDIDLIRQRHTDYERVLRLTNRKSTQKDAVKAWDLFVQRYGTVYDPNNLAEVLNEAKLGSVETPSIASDSAPKPKPAPPTAPSKPTHSKIYDILPAPFDLIKIPVGDVTIEGKTEAVAAFQIAKYPVTNAQFTKFLEAGGYKQKQWWTDTGWQQKEEDSWTEPRYWQDKKWNGPEYPVVGVSWYEAVAFCVWLSEITGEDIMLPTEQQWQRAAQGDDGRIYPWGNDWDCKRCNNSVKPCDSNQTTPVRQYEGKDKGDSPFGVVDMAGNVWEWCRTAYETGSQDINGTDVRVLRGGSWNVNDLDYFRVGYRFRNYPYDWYFNGGFRLALS